MSYPPPNRPVVAANFALTWDARVSTRDRTPSDFSSPRDKQRMLEIRASGDAVLVGRATLKIDATNLALPDEQLRARRVAEGKPPQPMRVVVTNSGKLDADLSLFQSDDPPVLVFSTERMPPETQAALRGKARLYLTREPAVDLRAMLETLWRECSVRRVVSEGGPTLFRSLLELDLVDEINVTFCPLVFGGMDAPTLTGTVAAFLSHSRECRLESTEIIGEECFARYRVSPRR